MSGLTLIELLVTLAVFALLAVMAAPSFNSMTSNNRLTSQINMLSGNLAFARTEAVKRGATVTLTTADNSNNWHVGWTATEAGGTDVRITAAMTNGLTLTTNVSSVQFLASGRVTTQRVFLLCDDRSGNFGKQITLLTTGKTTLTLDAACP